MSQAWLDSLSEDWVSQPPSESTPPPPSPPQDARNTSASPSRKNNNSNNNAGGASRIPRLHAGRKKSNSLPSDGSNILSERSINEITVPGSRRAPSKLSRQVMAEEDGSGRDPSRSASVATSDSVVQNTVNHREHGRDGAQTPEWKRRLVYGSVEYGAQRDLFTSAGGAGLENIFKPPPPMPPSDMPESPTRQNQTSRHDVTLPSSPPVFHRDFSVDIHVDDSALDDMTGLPERPAPAPMTFRRTNNTTDSFLDGDQSVPPGLDDTDIQSPAPAPAPAPAPPASSHPHIREELSPTSAVPKALGDAGLRAISGQTHLNEDFSPILLSCHEGDDGRATYTPVEIPAGELRHRLETLHRSQMLLVADSNGETGPAGGPCPDESDGCGWLGAFVNLRRGGRSADGSFRDRLLSSGLNDTSELPDESLQASTPKRFPTFGPGAAGPGAQSPRVPPAPYPSPEKNRDRLKSSTGSPLKLFQPYDTYTNQTLLRRLSQFEDPASDESVSAAQPSAEQSVLRELPTSANGANANGAVSGTTAHHRDGAAPRGSLPQYQQPPQRHPTTAVNTFGAGDLDAYAFRQEDVSLLSNQDSALPEGDSSVVSSERQSGSAVPEPHERIFNDSGESWLGDEDALVVQRRRQKSLSSSQSSHRRSAARPRSLQAQAADHALVVASTPKPQEGTVEGKRPRTTPAKDPTPKRRRTLHKSDIAYAADEQTAVAALETVQLSHQQMQSIIGKKRKDARHGDAQQPANPLVLANRQILNPRTPTPTQKQLMQQQQQQQHAHYGHDYHYDYDFDYNHSQSYSSRDRLPSQEPTTPGGSDVSLDTDRKPSIKTEDFINEANKIMAMIRSKAGLRSGLASVEESDLENAEQQQQQSTGHESEDSFAESTSEPFSRPPSREGRGAPPPPPWLPPRQEDPEIALRLKKYEEDSEMGDIIGSSMRSLGLAHDAIRTAHEVNQQVRDTLAGSVARAAAAAAAAAAADSVVSDPPNIRLSHNPDRLSGSHAASIAQDLQDADSLFPSGRSGTLSGHSTGSGSIPTGSSRGSGSDSRKVIAPESVEHLIPDQVGNMVLDRRRNMWVKRRRGVNGRSSGGGGNGNSSSRKSKKSLLLPSEASEEDPFAGIPDLSVDTAIELQNLELAAAAHGQEEHMAEFRSDTQTPASTGWMQDPPSELRSPSRSPPPSPSTRRPMPAPAADTSADDASVLEPGHMDDVEREISIHEDRLGSSTPKRKHLTITFSSPIASVIQDIAADDPDRSSFLSLHDHSGIAADSSSASLPNRRGRRPAQSQPGSRPPPKGAVPRSRSSSGPASRRISVGGHPFFPRPVSRIDEQDEDADNAHGASHHHKQDHRASASRRHHRQSDSFEVSVVGDETKNDGADDAHQSSQVSFVVATPARGRDCPVAGAEAAPVISQYVGTFSLSPLSEFTVHHGEPSLPLEVSYVVDDHRLVTGDRDRRVLSANTRDLVHQLAEVEPFEPYWEDLRELDVAGRRLESLQALDEFCGRLETLDASANRIRNLGGVPASVRQLRVAHNCLSGLSAWAHLANLQYVDVSANQLTSLAPFRDLVHLRSLRADDNRLTSLDGVKFHDGLQVLRLRGNAIENVDLDGTRLLRLTELDLRRNHIHHIAHLDQLPALATLNLDDNRLGGSLVIGGADSNNDATSARRHPCPSLRYLTLNDNDLERIDLAGFPGIRLLHADRNRLRRISGFSRTRRLDSLSLREQRREKRKKVGAEGDGDDGDDEDDDQDSFLDASFLAGAYEVRKLYLSGNRLAGSGFDPQVDFLNLQLLELANCGLRTLPPGLGQMMPNLRVVNLNFNALSDLGPLQFVPRLKRILAAGNRLADSAALVRTLAGFPQLSRVDLRDNPATQGFYAPPVRQVALQQRPRGGNEEKDRDDQDGNNAAAAAAAAAADPFGLPDADPQRDATYASRLDLETRMRRRLYEQVMASSCGRLKTLDGLPLRRDVHELRDAVWTALAAQGLILSQDGKPVDVSSTACGDRSSEEQSRWEAENSFA